jgi:hypothetical protein
MFHVKQCGEDDLGVKAEVFVDALMQTSEGEVQVGR